MAAFVEKSRIARLQHCRAAFRASEPAPSSGRLGFGVGGWPLRQ